MKFLSHSENRVKCGRCATEFDLMKNASGCPLCGFGPTTYQPQSAVPSTPAAVVAAPVKEVEDLLIIPPHLKLPTGTVELNEETKTVGHWGMFNDFFSGKAILRITANMLVKNKAEWVPLQDVLSETKTVVAARKMQTLKGFPSDLKKEASLNRLVYHFVAGYHRMGLMDAKVTSEQKKPYLWNNDWRKIMVRPTKEGLEFARLHNVFFDEGDYSDQVLSEEETKWMLDYLKQIDKKGFREYTTLKSVYDFLHSGKNGKDDLWDWFEHNAHFIAYVKSWSSKAEDPKTFGGQLVNLSKTFSSSKVSLLRELRLVDNKRNSYTIIGGM